MVVAAAASSVALGFGGRPGMTGRGLMSMRAARVWAGTEEMRER